MATVTGTGAVHLSMIKTDARRPAIGGVTGLTNVGGINVAVR